MFRFTIRDVLWLMVVVAVAIGWWMEYRKSQPYRFTNQPLDMAIAGNGFFQLSDLQTSKVVFTRFGNLSLDSSRLVLKTNGTARPIDPTIEIPKDCVGVSISPTGRVMVQSPRKNELEAVGQLQLSIFPNPEKLKRVAPAVYEATDESGVPCQFTPGDEGAGTIIQGMLEMK